VTRSDVEGYLKALGQAWREDSSNQDLSHTRNRVRHQLLPLLEGDFNPGIKGTLADLAETARAESEYWDQETEALLARIIRLGKPSRSGRSSSRELSRTLSLDLTALTALPLALERQLLHRVGRQLGSSLEFAHVEQLRELAREKRAGKRVILPGGLVAARSFRELQFTTQEEVEDERSAAAYEYPLRVPGETQVPELGSVIYARLIQLGNAQGSAHGYDSGSLLNPARLAAQLIVRSWRAGDRFFPARTRAPKKLKELLQPDRLGRHVLPDERKYWPVVESAGEIVWVRGFAVPEAFAAAGGAAVLIEERQSHLRG
jgi:tRNA(Ile)-lysidine synthase